MNEALGQKRKLAGPLSRLFGFLSASLGRDLSAKSKCSATRVYKTLRLVGYTAICVISVDLMQQNSVRAQVTPDGSIPSIVMPQGNTILIEGGSEAGSNLFHSFAEFSVPANMEAFFNNGANVENIITRVTGDNISNIEGLIRANGAANLFLLNPNGIFFGDSARLALGGSLLASTAESLQFGDGLEFSANAGTSGEPLLSVNVPIGLQFGSNPGSIEIRGTFEDTFEIPRILSAGNNDPSFISITNSLSRPANLTVAPGRTLALAGGEITVEGAQISAPGGRITLGSVGPDSSVGIAPAGDLTYDGVSTFGDINLDSSATLNASGDGGGRLQLRGRHISLTDDAVAIANNLGDRTNSFTGIDIVAEELTLQEEAILSSLALGNFANGPSQDGSISFGSGSSGDATIQVGTLTLDDRSVVATVSLGTGNAGGIAISATDAISITNGSSISTSSAGTGGPIDIETRRLTLGDTGQIATATVGFGPGGNLNIRASESIVLNPGPPVVSANQAGALLLNGLFSSTFGAGNAGNIVIATDRLSISGAVISSATEGEGEAGTITIRANSLEAIGSSAQGVEMTAITSDGSASGSAGSVALTIDEVTVGNGARLLVSNSGSGDAGSLSVTANNLNLEDGGEIAASTVSGTGGSLVLTANTLTLRRGARIATDAGSTDGGNITINTDVLAALGNSDITANAETGFGGRVSVTATGIFGIDFRQQLTPESDITATSNLGAEFSGEVEINTPDTDPTSGLLELAASPSDPNQKVLSGCAADEGNEFYIIGRGGIPDNPLDTLRRPPIWRDMRAVTPNGIPIESQSHKPKPQPQIVEATGWVVSSDGSVELVARPASSSAGNLWHRLADCGDLHSGVGHIR